MSDVLLAHAYFLEGDAAEQRVMKPYSPLGILSLSAWLKMRGFDVNVFDSTFSTHGHFERLLLELRPRIVGISVNMVTKFAAIRMLRAAKAAGCFTVLGGPEPASYAEQYLAEGADAIVAGEGEETLEEVVRHVLSGLPRLDDIAGIVWKTPEGPVRRNTARTFLSDSDMFPMPDRGAIDFRPYFDAWKQRHGYSTLSILTMRGCPYTCSWCSHSVYGESYRRRSPELVADEIVSIRDAYNPDALWFADDVFTISHTWLAKLRDEMQLRGLHIPFECISRADRLTPEVVGMLKAMGCFRIWIGAESGSQRILDAMRRGVRVDQVEAMTGECRKAGIEVGTFIMLGYAGEAVGDILATAAYLRRSRPDKVLTTVAYPIKGTRYHEELGPLAVAPSLPFDAWNDRQHAVGGRYNDRFYWHATRYVVNEAALGRAVIESPTHVARIATHWVKSKVTLMGMYFHARKMR